MKYVVVVGGTMSGIGKGTLMSSIGVILRACNVSCSAIKIDPYLNQDAGTISPEEHGEVYVLRDGGEADLDLGNYERFLNLRLSRDNSITTGKIFRRVLANEREGVYLGKTVQMVPHIVETVIDWIERVSPLPVDRSGWKAPEICLLEIGGTVGDLESDIYMEVIRQLRLRIGPDNICICHLSYVPVLGANEEQKSKPTQHSVKTMLERGLQPNIIFCRCKSELSVGTRRKIALFTQVKMENVFSVHNTDDLYSVPLMLDGQGVAGAILKHLNFSVDDSTPLPPQYSIESWRNLTKRVSEETVTIGIVGKYNGYTDSYLSLCNAIRHSTIECGMNLEVKWIDCQVLETLPYAGPAFTSLFTSLDAVIVPGGFGERGITGKCLAARYCAEKPIPFLGICLGMQAAVVEAVRRFQPLAFHAEFSQGPQTQQEGQQELAGQQPGSQIPQTTGQQVGQQELEGQLADQQAGQLAAIISMPEHNGEAVKGGTMRLGIRETILEPDSLAFQVYDQERVIFERYRHRFEVNTFFREELEKEGFRFTGMDSTGKRMCIMESVKHEFYVGTQFHPEYESTPFRPSPCILALVLAGKGRLGARLEAGKGRLRAGQRLANPE